MDTVILAGGSNERLRSIIPSYQKPMLVINGETLIAQCVRRAFEAKGRIIIVAAPANVSAIVDVTLSLDPLGSNLPALPALPSRILYVVQPLARGVHDALAIGCEMVRSEKVLVLMGDNIIPVGEVNLTCEMAKASEIVVTTTKVSRGEAQRFTWRDRDGAWWDKATPDDVGDYAHDEVDAWVGPLVMRANIATDGRSWDEKFNADPPGVCARAGWCQDVGVPGAL